MRRSLCCLALFSCAVAVFAIPAFAQDLTFTANPPRAQVSSGSAKPAALPACLTSDPTVPTTPIIYCYTPGFIYSAYNIPQGLTGAGQTIVIVDAYGSPTVANDLAVFDAVTGLPNPDFEIACPQGCPNFNPRNAPQAEADWSFETSLDVQWAHAIAPAAKIVLVVAATAHGDAINNAVKYAVAHYPGSIISQSFGIPEAGIHANNSQLAQAHQNYVAAAAAGITVLAPAGDYGAINGVAPFPNASYPASDPYVTGVGGTQGLPLGGLVTPSGYGAEAVWNESWADAAGGGALSALFAAPAFQAGLPFTTRAVPDVAYNAAIDGGVLVFYSAEGPAQEGFYIVGGTSAGSPQWAGIFALTNQLRALYGKGPIGFANPALYSIAQSPAYATDFHDITVGNNVLVGTSAGFAATTGYDLATGWGTPNAANLVSDLAAH